MRRRSLLVPVALLCITAVASAATGVALGIINLGQAAQRNALDTPLELFQADLPANSVPRPAPAWKQTVIASSVRMIAKPHIPGIGAVQYWVADTRQHGICTAIRLPDGSWAGLKNFRQVGGALVGCRPTRTQISAGALILSGFDYTDSEVIGEDGQKIILNYGEITAPGHPTEIENESTGARSRVIDGKYFLLVSYPTRGVRGGTDVGDGAHLIALDASGAVVANERKPLREVH